MVAWVLQEFNMLKRLDHNVVKVTSPSIIEVDGGVNSENSTRCVQAGCNILVAGSSVFNSNDYKKNIDNISKNM